MKKNIKILLKSYLTTVTGTWGFLEAYSYFRGEDLKIILGIYWWAVIYIFPFVVSILVFLKSTDRTSTLSGSLKSAVDPELISNSITARSTFRLLVSPSVSRFRLHIDQLTNWRPLPSSRALQSTPVGQDEQWEVVDRWPAFPELPTPEEVQAKLDLRGNFKLIGMWLGLALGATCWIIVFTTKTRVSEMSWIYVPLVSMAVGFLVLYGSDVGAWLFNRFIVSTLPYSERSNWCSEFDLISREGLMGLGSLDPRQVFWHPNGIYLFVSRDHCHLNTWAYYEGNHSLGLPPCHVGPVTDSQLIFCHGHIDKVFFSDDGWFLTKGQSTLWWVENKNQWTIYSSQGRIEVAIKARNSALPLFGSLQCNPWRPGHQKEILTIPANGLLSLCDASDLPRSLDVSGSDWSKVRASSKSTLDLGLIQLSEKEAVGTFAWHPSGLYLAIELAGRIDIIHWDSAEKVLPHSIVSQDGAKYQAAGWSPDGTLLALDKSISQVFDVRTSRPRMCELHERWNLHEQNLEAKLTSCDGLRRFSKSPNNRGQWIDEKSREQLLGVTDIAWHPRNPNLFATIGGEDSQRAVRVWKLVKSKYRRKLQNDRTRTRS